MLSALSMTARLYMLFWTRYGDLALLNSVAITCMTPDAPTSLYLSWSTLQLPAISSFLQAFVCHIGFVADGQPFVIPTGFARDNEQLYFHGSVGSRMLRALSSGAGDTCSVIQLPCCDIYIWHRASNPHTDTSHHAQALTDLLASKLKDVCPCADICVTVTLLDGLVLARSQFNTDMVRALLVLRVED